MPKKIVVLSSGGLDSMVLSYMLVAEGHSVRLLHFDLQKNSSTNELAASKLTAFLLGLPLEIVSLRGFTQMQLGYMPTDYVFADELDGPSHPSGRGDRRAFPVLIAAGIHFADITGSEALAVGAIREQADPIPGLREFFTKIGPLTALVNPGTPPIEIMTPFIGNMKAEVIQIGNTHNVPMESSWTCFFGGMGHCGVCVNCQSRKNGFATANVKDVTQYLA